LPDIHMKYTVFQKLAPLSPSGGLLPVYWQTFYFKVDGDGWVQSQDLLNTTLVY